MLIRSNIRKEQFIYTNHFNTANKRGTNLKRLQKSSSNPQNTCINIYRVGFK